MSNTLSRRPRDPFFAEFDTLVRSAFGPSASAGLARSRSGSTSFSPAAEVHRDGDDAVIRVELPGVSTDDVTVEVKGRHLVISGSRRDQREERSEQSGRRFSEFRYGSFTRSFRLAPNVTAEAVDVKAGTTGTTITGNAFDGRGMTAGLGVWVDVQGNDAVVTNNQGSVARKDGFSVNVPSDAATWGHRATFRGNTADVQGPGYGFRISAASQGTVVGCDNTVTGAASGFANVKCAA